MALWGKTLFPINENFLADKKRPKKTVKNFTLKFRKKNLEERK